jgi:hypothetical protein
MIWAGLLKKPFEVVRTRPHPTLVIRCGGQGAPHTRVSRLAVIVIGHGRGPVKVLLAPLSAAIDALLGVMGGDVRWCLHVAAQGRLPASLGRAKHDRVVAGSALGGDAAQLLKHVPEEVAMFALSWALHVALGQRARTTLASLAPCLGLAAPTLPP